MEILKAALLGLIQGATEFLPISSSGHLIAAKEIFGFQAPLAFDVSLHLATLAAVFIYFGRYIVRLAFSSEWRPLVLRLVLGTIPAALIAVGLSNWRENISPWLVVAGWLVSSTYLLLAARREGKGPYITLPLPRAFLIGGSQGIAAIFPGFSRSGASITSGLWLGLRREEAFRFSFLLSIPVIVGAGLFEGRQLFDSGGATVPGGWPALTVAVAVAFVVGIVAIHVLFRVVVGNHFHRFGWYNLAVAIGFAAYLISR